RTIFPSHRSLLLFPTLASRHEWRSAPRVATQQGWDSLFRESIPIQAVVSLAICLAYSQAVAISLPFPVLPATAGGAGKGQAYEEHRKDDDGTRQAGRPNAGRVPCGAGALSRRDARMDAGVPHR